MEPESEDAAKATDADVESTDNDCGAVFDGGKDDISPVQIWQAVMQKYKVAEKCDKELERLYAVQDKEKIDRKKEEKLLAIAAAVEALAKLHHKDTLSKLRQFAAQDSTTGMTSVIIEHATEYMSNREPLFWFSCFVRLFPRGDCAMNCPERVQGRGSMGRGFLLGAGANFS